MKTENLALTKAQESRNAIERLYIEMRHLFNRGVYKPSGITGSEVRASLRTLSPEIYGSLNDNQKVELDGLIYVIDRLPKGIEECSFIKFTSEEGFEDSTFEPIIPLKRRRNCYRVDQKQINIEVTRGRSEIYDALTHLTFLFNEAEKIRINSVNEDDQYTREWKELENIVVGGKRPTPQTINQAFTYLSTILGRTFEETKQAYHRLAENSEHNTGLFNIVYWLGKLAGTEGTDKEILHDREISFTPTLRERIGRHIHGERWAANIKKALLKAKLIDRPLHIVSANMHSVVNCLYAYPALKETFDEAKSIEDIAVELSKEENKHLRDIVEKYAKSQGLIFLPDSSGTNLGVQIIDTSKLMISKLSSEITINKAYIREKKPVIIVMDYAFGEQAYETMDELLKPIEVESRELPIPMPVASISIMGKAGILQGGKGDIMIPNAHVFEGTADNYPFQNDFTKEDFAEMGCCVCTGPMITVLGTSLQNREVLAYFKNSSWKAIGLEMEGAHYQKAIQAETRIRKNIANDIVIRYAYYASDNPLETGSTLASGSLGLVGIRPTYLITRQILNKIFTPKKTSNTIPKKPNTEIAVAAEGEK